MLEYVYKEKGLAYILIYIFLIFYFFGSGKRYEKCFCFKLFVKNIIDYIIDFIINNISLLKILKFLYFLFNLILV